jgi:hypothetical protein
VGITSGRKSGGERPTKPISAASCFDTAAHCAPSSRLPFVEHPPKEPLGLFGGEAALEREPPHVRLLEDPNERVEVLELPPAQHQTLCLDAIHDPHDGMKVVPQSALSDVGGESGGGCL